ncbi:class I SAM-dependent methyltransferase [Bdellovibrionota bacterium FG-1]
MNPWDTRYGTDEFYYGTDPNDFLKANAKLIAPGGETLCLAEGEGRNAVFLAENGLKVTAVDGSSVGLGKMEKLAHAKNVLVTSIVSDLSDYQIEAGKWDCIVSIWCHVPQDLRRKLHHLVVEGLRPGGVFILEAYHPRQLEFKTGGPSDANLMMRLDDLREELFGLDFLVAHEIERDVHEGKGHFGKSAVVQVLGRKTVV